MPGRCKCLIFSTKRSWHTEIANVTGDVNVPGCVQYRCLVLGYGLAPRQSHKEMSRIDCEPKCHRFSRGKTYISDLFQWQQLAADKQTTWWPRPDTSWLPWFQTQSGSREKPAEQHQQQTLARDRASPGFAEHLLKIQNNPWLTPHWIELQS